MESSFVPSDFIIDRLYSVYVYIHHSCSLRSLLLSDPTIVCMGVKYTPRKVKEHRIKVFDNRMQ